MDVRSDEAIFMGYSLNFKAYRIFNKTFLIVEESIHVIFDETNVAPRKGVIANDDADIEDHVVEPKEKNEEDSKEDPPLEDLQRKEDQHDDLPKTWKFVRDHPIDQVIRNPIQGVRTRGALKETCEYATYISQLEPKNFKEAKNEES